MADMTNGKLGKFLSIEVLGMAISLIFVGGMAWASLNEKVNASQEETAAISRDMVEMKRELQVIKTSLEVIKLEQKYTARDLQEIKQQGKALAEIRKLLEKQE